MKRIVILTGAGMSVESGISTFRAADGLWENNRIEDVATPGGWQANPALVLEFYNQRRRQLLACKPNAGHIALAELENTFDVQIITQNVDNLHELAGSTKVLHLHGELLKARSTGRGQEVFQIDSTKPDIVLGDFCPKGFQLRPHIVWFGEAVPEIERAQLMVEQADIFIVIGTSLQVYPAAGLLQNVKYLVPKYLIDPNEMHNLPKNITVIRKIASEGMIELIKILKSNSLSN